MNKYQNKITLPANPSLTRYFCEFPLHDQIILKNEFLSYSKVENMPKVLIVEDDLVFANLYEQKVKNIAHEAGVFRPVHPEMEFLNDPRNDTHREVDQKQFSPEPCHQAIKFVSSPIMHRLHYGDQQGQAECQGNEQEVVR